MKIEKLDSGEGYMLDQGDLQIVFDGVIQTDEGLKLYLDDMAGKMKIAAIQKCHPLYGELIKLTEAKR